MQPVLPAASLKSASLSADAKLEVTIATTPSSQSRIVLLLNACFPPRSKTDMRVPGEAKVCAWMRVARSLRIRDPPTQMPSSTIAEVPDGPWRTRHRAWPHRPHRRPTSRASVQQSACPIVDCDRGEHAVERLGPKHQDVILATGGANEVRSSRSAQPRATSGVGSTPRSG